MKKYGNPQTPLESCFELLYQFLVNHLFLTLGEEQDKNQQDFPQEPCSGRYSNGVSFTWLHTGASIAGGLPLVCLGVGGLLYLLSSAAHSLKIIIIIAKHFFF